MSVFGKDIWVFPNHKDLTQSLLFQKHLPKGEHIPDFQVP